MPSQAEKEQARRRAIEKAYTPLEPLHEWHPARLDERPGPIPARIVKAAEALGWSVHEMARTDWHPPKWVTDEHSQALYVAQPRRQYHLLVSIPVPRNASWKAYAKAARAEGKTVGAVDLLYLDGAKHRLRLGLFDSGTWADSDLSTNSLAKLITEQGFRP